MQEIFRLREEHYEKGTLQDFVIKPYQMDPAVEINTTVAEDEEIISICSPIREMEPQILKCLKCRKSFPLQSELVTHLQKCPKSTNKFSCLLCGIKFSTDFRCNYHEFHICLKMGNIHEKFKCGECEVYFYIEQNFKIHQREVCRRGGMKEDVEHGVGREVEADVGGGELGSDLGGEELGGNLGGGELGGDLGRDVEGMGVEADVGGGELGGNLDGR